MTLGFKNKKNVLNEKKIINNLKALALDMINNAKSGHPGISIDMASTIYTLYAKHLKYDTKNPDWINRDRLLLSAGHVAPLVYATLFMVGFDITLEDLKALRRLGSITPGHPEINVTPGIDVSTGPLGQGVANAVGVAIGERFLNARYKKNNLIDYYTYVLCGDGDLMEGVSYEALSLASTLKLNKLIVIYDSNNITLDGRKSQSFTENIEKRFEALNFNIIHVKDGDNIDSLDKAIIRAKSSKEYPSIIIVNTIIGKGSILENTNLVHGTPLEEEDLANLKESLGVHNVPFTISDDAVNDFRLQVQNRLENVYHHWHKKYERLDDETRVEVDKIINNDLTFDLLNLTYDLPDDLKESTREASGFILNQISKSFPLLIGGSADLSSSTKTYLNDEKDFTSANYSGRNIWFGVREHAMGSILNGMALAGVRPFGSTFLAFSDYLKPALRMSALMNLPVIYIFTHDSVTVGEDGPAHQPVEQLVTLRSTPNLTVFRPADLNEVIGSYKVLMMMTTPVALILGRNRVKIQKLTSAMDVSRGGYILKQEEKEDFVTLITCGEELENVLEATDNLISKGYGIRVVSMPSIELFKKQSLAYQEKIIPKDKLVIAIELGSSYSWYQFTKHVISVDQFGYSGKKNEILEKFGFDSKTLEERIERIINNNK